MPGTSYKLRKPSTTSTSNLGAKACRSGLIAVSRMIVVQLGTATTLGPAGPCGCTLAMRPDGNLVLLGGDGAQLWETHTRGSERTARLGDDRRRPIAPRP